MRDEVNTRLEPSEELEPIPLDDNPEHLAYIGSKLADDLKSLLTQFLRQNKDVFTWKQADMGGIDPAIITHRLNVNPSFKPVKQKRRSFAPKKTKIDQRGGRQAPPGRGNKRGGVPRMVGQHRTSQKSERQVATLHRLH